MKNFLGHKNMPISTVSILKYILTKLCLSGFELYSRWVPLICSALATEFYLLCSTKRGFQGPSSFCGLQLRTFMSFFQLCFFSSSSLLYTTLVTFGSSIFWGLLLTEVRYYRAFFHRLHLTLAPGLLFWCWGKTKRFKLRFSFLRSRHSGICSCESLFFLLSACQELKLHYTCIRNGGRR